MKKQSELFKTKFVPGKPGSGMLFDEEIVTGDGPVKCLGLEFENDEARRAHFTEELRKKLQDPEFRKIEGFPIGEDEDILKLSDPPYYTACPNPWIADFIDEWESQKPEKPANYHYHREPFAADVSEGKNDPIYNAHSYHTKVPHKAIMRYILHYTEPGDIVFDGFCGTGMTGVAAQMCGDQATVESLGYKVDQDGVIYQKVYSEEPEVRSAETNAQRTTHHALEKGWQAFSRLGTRKAVLNDLSPAATFIAYNYNTPVDIKAFKKEYKKVLSDLKKSTGWMWETFHSDGKTKGKINYIVWSDVYNCPECLNQFTYYDEAFIKKSGKVEFKPEFNCPHCNCLISKNPSKKSLAQKPSRVFENHYDPISLEVEHKQKQVPVLMNYSVGTKRFEKLVDAEEKQKIEKINSKEILTTFVPNTSIIEGDKSADPFSCGVRHIHQFYTKRILLSLSKLTELSGKNPQLSFLIGSALPKLTIMNRYMPQHGGRALVGPMANTLYVPPVNVENNSIDQIEFQFKKIAKALTSLDGSIISTSAAQSLKIPEASMDYIFLDPPFGANIMYSELSYIREAWLRVFTNNKPEAIENKTQKKGIDEYRKLMTDCFNTAFRYLKPGCWMTVEFSNTKSSVWNSIQNALSDAGFIVASVAALDKTRGGLHAMIGPTAVKKDLVISAYKPNGGFEERFEYEAQTEEGVWDFIRTHLKYLPVTKKLGLDLVSIPERDPRILYDQVIAYYVRKGYSVPIDSQDFQLGLSQRFSERYGMYFLPEQVAEYDRKKMIGGGRPLQQSLFISDETSAIEWLRSLLRVKPQSFQDINPQFMKEISGWKKNEKGLELSTLLEQNFLCYDGKGPVPEQIHSYLSTNWKDMRNLDKDDPALVAKAKNRWYVPDPNKAGDLEKLREKALLKEFEEYKQAKKKLKVFRLEAVRAGFKKAWQERDYKMIITVAEKIPNKVLEEDPKLLMWYENAVTRMGGE
jgi:hypothetical protein